MELILSRDASYQATVICDGQLSHTADLSAIPPLPQDNYGEHPPANPILYGQALYGVLFPSDSAAAHSLSQRPNRIVFIASDLTTQSIPWEYIHDGTDFLVKDYLFARGLLPDERQNLPPRPNELHVLAVASQPLDARIAPLDIEAEWVRLREEVAAIDSGITLERVRPATIEGLRRCLANRRGQVVHFMGHGGQEEEGAVLLFEQEDGGPSFVSARDFMRRARNSTFLVTLNACVSAAPGATTFANLAHLLTQQGTPYAIGMRFSITDEDARAFARTFYRELASASGIEEALLQARLKLAKSRHAWAIGVPVLYTALSEPEPGFQLGRGQPQVIDGQPPLDVAALPRTEGEFRGRIEELRSLGKALTRDRRPYLLTIHGSSGQGKSALARVACERFAWAWPGGVWATSFVSLPSRALFVSTLARFLGIATDKSLSQDDVEREVVERLGQKRMLVVLDNMETLVEAAESGGADALDLAQFLRKQMPTTVSILATSQRQVNWPGEIVLELGGLTREEGARLFRQSAPRRQSEAVGDKAMELSDRVTGHPLTLRLLGSAFNNGTDTVDEFVEHYEQNLSLAVDRWETLGHRQRSLYTAVETSLRTLPPHLRILLADLWVFEAAFPSYMVAAMLEDETVLPASSIFYVRSGFLASTGQTPFGWNSPVEDQLVELADRSLLLLSSKEDDGQGVVLYRLHPAVRMFVREYLEGSIPPASLLERFGLVYGHLVRILYEQIDSHPAVALLVQEMRGDLLRGEDYATGQDQAFYRVFLGWLLFRMGDSQSGIAMMEKALAGAEGNYPRPALDALHNLALAYQLTGQAGRALELHDRLLARRRAAEDRRNEGTTLNNMGGAHMASGRVHMAIDLFEQALQIARETGDREGEARALNNLGEAYRILGNLERALDYLERALPIRREVNDRLGEAKSLSNLATLYGLLGDSARAFPLFEQARVLAQQMGDRAGEATVLLNIGQLHQNLDAQDRARVRLEEALEIMRETGDPQGEAAALNNLAGVYSHQDMAEEALTYYNLALDILRRIGDREGQATTLSNMGLVYLQRGEHTKTVSLLEQSLEIARENGNPGSEAAYMYNLAETLSSGLGQKGKALQLVMQARSILHDHGLTYDSLGNALADYDDFLSELQSQEVELPESGRDSAVLAPEQLEIIIANTVGVMTDMRYKWFDWRKEVAANLQMAQSLGMPHARNAELFAALLALLDGDNPDLPANHPYAEVLQQIHMGISGGGTENVAQAVRAYLEAEGWLRVRAVLEQHSSLLTTPGVTPMLKQSIREVEAANRVDIAEYLKRRLALLQACRREGIASVFARIEREGTFE